MVRAALRRGAHSVYTRLLIKAQQPRRRPLPRALPIANVIQLDARTSEAYLHRSINGLHETHPQLSAQETTSRHQRIVLISVAVVVLISLVVFTRQTVVAAIAVATYVYTAITLYRVGLFRRSLRSDELISIPDDVARAVPAADLPIYTVLIPAYREPEVIATLLADVLAMDYPVDRLDVKLLIEQDDEATLNAVYAAAPPPHITVLLIPPSDPRTKPKALNYGLCLARGSLVTIYDAEDRPEPLQLRRAAVAFSRCDPSVVCLQAALAYYNYGQNIITKWFQVEYVGWFRFFLPGLASRQVPIPLGGTSNHIRRSALEEIGGWDAFNVTEDADLGIRLHRRGYRCGVLDSVTYEEATSDFVNWARQRSRWHKGYLQTWLVHMRHPRQLYRELGGAGFANFNLFVGGTPLLALLNPIFWTLTILWFLTESPVIAALFPAWVYYPALLCWVIGNAAVAYLSLLSVHIAEQPKLGLAALISPLYWVMMSVAAYKAAWQLVREPSLWEKTTHGMSLGDATEPRVEVAGAV
jgi:cellulose synthase/poly-beta-1,6-N-acetylglucosamine synthase-like glycosyltransferase